MFFCSQKCKCKLSAGMFQGGLKFIKGCLESFKVENRCPRKPHLTGCYNKGLGVGFRRSEPNQKNQLQPDTGCAGQVSKASYK